MQRGVRSSQRLDIPAHAVNVAKPSCVGILANYCLAFRDGQNGACEFNGAAPLVFIPCGHCKRELHHFVVERRRCELVGQRVDPLPSRQPLQKCSGLYEGHVAVAWLITSRNHILLPKLNIVELVEVQLTARLQRVRNNSAMNGLGVRRKP